MLVLSKLKCVKCGMALNSDKLAAKKVTNVSTLKISQSAQSVKTVPTWAKRLSNLTQSRLPGRYTPAPPRPQNPQMIHYDDNLLRF